MKPKSNDLFDFMVTITHEMAREYERIQKRATEDPGTAGDQGEENWATLLRGWLPPTYQIVTKGRILSHEGVASPQVDVLVLRPSYPKHLLDKKLYLAGGIAAAFECKVTLKPEHIRSSIQNSVKIRQNLPLRKGSPYKELHSPIIYGILAHSHIWKNKGSTPETNINNHLYTADHDLVTHPREMLDIVCVADLATWTSHKAAFLGPAYLPDGVWPTVADQHGPEGSASTAYVGHSHNSENQTTEFTPIGSIVSSLFHKLGWDEPSIREIADYFRLSNLGGSGAGIMRHWDVSIYSDEIRTKVVSGSLVNGSVWHEWSMVFM